MPDVGKPYLPTTRELLDVLASVNWDEIYKSRGRLAPNISRLRSEIPSDKPLDAQSSQDVLGICAVATTILEQMGDAYTQVVLDLRRKIGIIMALHVRRIYGEDFIEIDYDAGSFRLNPDLSDERRAEVAAILQWPEPPATECDA